MCDEFINPGLVQDPRLTRRAFGVMSLAAAGAACATVPKIAVTETDVGVKTPDGTADAVLFAPAKAGKFPAVLMWPDIMGLRPAFREMGRRLAGDGYVVLVPNPYYRTRRAPVIEGTIDFSNPQQRETLMGLRKTMTDDRVAKDAAAYFAFLDAQAKTDKRRAAGVQGYCMSGAFSFISAASVPNRVRAVASFHGGNGLATKDANSPHLLIPKINATFLVLQAQNDDAQQPQVKDMLKGAFAAAHKKATVEVYPADHGWCVPGSQAYNQAQAERAWTALLQLYRATLV